MKADPTRRKKLSTITTAFASPTMRRSKQPGNTSKPTKRNTTSARSPSRRARISLTRSIFASPAATTWKSNITIPAARCMAARTPPAIGTSRSPTSAFPARLPAASVYSRHASVRRHRAQPAILHRSFGTGDRCGIQHAAIHQAPGGALVHRRPETKPAPISRRR